MVWLADALTIAGTVICIRGNQVRIPLAKPSAIWSGRSCCSNQDWVPPAARASATSAGVTPQLKRDSRCRSVGDGSAVAGIGRASVSRCSHGV